MSLVLVGIDIVSNSPDDPQHDTENRETRAPSWHVEGYGLFLWLLSTDDHIAPGYDCCFNGHVTRLLTWRPLALLIFLDMSCWESSWSEKWTVFVIITGWILVCMITNLVWNVAATNLSCMWPTQIRHTAFWGKWGNQDSWGNADWNYTKVLVEHKALSEGHERSFTYCSMARIETDRDFHQLWCETFILVGWLYSIVGHCMSMSSSKNTQSTVRYLI